MKCFPVRIDMGLGTKHDAWEPTSEAHHLIYADRFVALTAFEYCFAAWSMTTGECVGGSLWGKRGDWELSPGERLRIRDALVGVSAVMFDYDPEGS